MNESPPSLSTFLFFVGLLACVVGHGNTRIAKRHWSCPLGPLVFRLSSVALVSCASARGGLCRLFCDDVWFAVFFAARETKPLLYPCRKSTSLTYRRFRHLEAMAARRRESAPTLTGVRARGGSLNLQEHLLPALVGAVVAAAAAAQTSASRQRRRRRPTARPLATGLSAASNRSSSSNNVSIGERRRRERRRESNTTSRARNMEEEEKEEEEERAMAEAGPGPAPGPAPGPVQGPVLKTTATPSRTRTTTLAAPRAPRGS